jgi:hypothetical protein
MRSAMAAGFRIFCVVDDFSRECLLLTQLGSALVPRATAIASGKASQCWLICWALLRLWLLKTPKALESVVIYHGPP